MTRDKSLCTTRQDLCSEVTALMASFQTYLDIHGPKGAFLHALDGTPPLSLSKLLGVVDVAPLVKVAGMIDLHASSVRWQDVTAVVGDRGPSEGFDRWFTAKMKEGHKFALRVYELQPDGEPAASGVAAGFLRFSLFVSFSADLKNQIMEWAVWAVAADRLLGRVERAFDYSSATATSETSSIDICRMLEEVVEMAGRQEF